jgi:hypothetical protein
LLFIHQALFIEHFLNIICKHSTFLSVTKLLKQAGTIKFAVEFTLNVQIKTATGEDRE